MACSIHARISAARCVGSAHSTQQPSIRACRRLFFTRPGRTHACTPCTAGRGAPSVCPARGSEPCRLPQGPPTPETGQRQCIWMNAATGARPTLQAPRSAPAAAPQSKSPQWLRRLVTDPPRWRQQPAPENVPAPLQAPTPAGRAHHASALVTGISKGSRASPRCFPHSQAPNSFSAAAFRHSGIQASMSPKQALGAAASQAGGAGAVARSPPWSLCRHARRPALWRLRPQLRPTPGTAAAASATRATRPREGAPV